MSKKEIPGSKRSMHGKIYWPTYIRAEEDFHKELYSWKGQ